jgi:hypothetical protein
MKKILEISKKQEIKIQDILPCGSAIGTNGF